MTIDLVIFDCDGVLVDSELISADVLIGQMRALGIAMDRDHVRREYLGRSFPSVAATIRKTFDRDLPEDIEARYRAALLSRFEAELRPTPGIEDILDRMVCKTCVATSSSPPRVQNSLRFTGLARYFDANVFTASQVARGKPAPDLFLFAAAQMDTTPDRVLVIEDSLPGIAAAVAAGMRVLRYAGGGHLHGQFLKHDADVTCFDTWADFPQNLLRPK
ncbi:HAD family phosphatase [Puniceibacterium sp. IMCC21224]|uniref:HAD family hydrolase n=1 Tax=Puniceibacterium sp. IMCC21224 TaxID=1618204 RepID=UPI00064DA658|nr:HAD family hydrolase [Puniceibacterium sp. IMCC21224]KMK66216.1 haloacid dehalogenase superfamily protein, subfamily IA, variant 3 with third motif having DD or ED [Puniceibacterium sp. IMCC21224]